MTTPVEGSGLIFLFLAALGGGAGLSALIQAIYSRRTAKSTAQKHEAEADLIAVQAAEKAVTILTTQLSAQTTRINELEREVGRLRRRVSQLESELIRQGLKVPDPLEDNAQWVL